MNNKPDRAYDHLPPESIRKNQVVDKQKHIPPVNVTLPEKEGQKKPHGDKK